MADRGRHEKASSRPYTPPNEPGAPPRHTALTASVGTQAPAARMLTRIKWAKRCSRSGAPGRAVARAWGQ